ncbi:hypothetical protein SAMN06297387_113107 [Streptomyces zhaozhouensis]|uniref:UL36 very large tegument protein n=1 Tax=Streptomyces zhaozhouensis TaxID=1300267 RepID=A0A286DZ54_9ACTN|nr:hypothetical protein [Streptomyces zhaozhouensis]SOD63948.1 hypothetical protein SAMN06297387_113107 [Streptomyces zhaozhouensis]
MPDVRTTEREWADSLAAFTSELRALVGVLDPATGWLAVFRRRNAAELAAWLAGGALPPWDAVADLLRDLTVRGAAAEPSAARLRARYGAAVRARDALPGGREALTVLLAQLDRSARELDARLGALTSAEEAARATGREREAERLAALAAWARDDSERVRGRRSEAHARLTALPAARPPADEGAREALARRRGRPARRPRGGARFAGIDPSGEAPPERAPDAAPAPTPVAVPPPPPPPSGSRFAGALRDHRPTLAERVTEDDLAAAADAAARLGALRAEGRSGAAHGLLSEVVGGPAVRLPLLLAALERAGLEAENATLLWEAGALPPGPLAAVAEALDLAGREEECGQLLRQGAARPAAEVGAVAAALGARGLDGEAVALLRAIVRSRTAEEAAQAARPAPEALVPILLTAAGEVSPRHHRAVVSELRRAGIA